MKKSLRAWLVWKTVIIILLIPVGLMLIPSGVEAEIEEGKISWSTDFGWINWGHAIPDGANKLLEEIKSKAEMEDSFTVRYCQNMKIKVSGKKAVAETCAEFRIPGGLSEQEQKEIALKIFMQVSEDFEKMQGGFPYFFMADARYSSFRDGDLSGNLIGFYAAANKKSISSIRDKLKTLSPEASLEKFKEAEMGKSREWIDIPLNCFSDSICTRLKSSKIFIELIKSDQDFYFE